MVSLEPCPHCRRHVRTDETVCPFCSAAIAQAMANAPARAVPQGRLGRAALLAFGASVAAASGEGCDDDRNVVPIYGNPVPIMDAGSTDASAPNDRNNTDAGNGGVAIYGAPAPRDAGTSDAGVDAGADAGDAGRADASVDSGRVDAIDDRFVPVYGAPVVRD
jgi:hypothetical protein